LPDPIRTRVRIRYRPMPSKRAYDFQVAIIRDVDYGVASEVLGNLKASEETFNEFRAAFTNSPRVEFFEG
jgi:hypothetical protein